VALQWLIALQKLWLSIEREMLALALGVALLITGASASPGAMLTTSSPVWIICPATDVQRFLASDGNQSLGCAKVLSSISHTPTSDVRELFQCCALLSNFENRRCLCRRESTVLLLRYNDEVAEIAAHAQQACGQPLLVGRACAHSLQPVPVPVLPPPPPALPGGYFAAASAEPPPALPGGFLAAASAEPPPALPGGFLAAASAEPPPALPGGFFAAASAEEQFVPPPAPAFCSALLIETFLGPRRCGRLGLLPANSSAPCCALLSRLTFARCFCQADVLGFLDTAAGEGELAGVLESSQRICGFEISGGEMCTPFIGASEPPSLPQSPPPSPRPPPPEPPHPPVPSPLEPPAQSPPPSLPPSPPRPSPHSPLKLSEEANSILRAFDRLQPPPLPAEAHVFLPVRRPSRVWHTGGGRGDVAPDPPGTYAAAVASLVVLEASSSVDALSGVGETSHNGSS
jgi:hypothetical protein